MSFTVEKRYKIRLGGNWFIDNQYLVVFNDEPLFDVKRHENGYLGIYLKIYDANGETIATVKRNELYFNKDTNRGKYVEAGTQNSYELKEKDTGKTIYSVKKRSAASPAELDVSITSYLPNGKLLEATPDGINLEGNFMYENVFMSNWAGMGIYENGSFSLGVGGPRRPPQKQEQDYLVVDRVVCQGCGFPAIEFLLRNDGEQGMRVNVPPEEEVPVKVLNEQRDLALICPKCETETPLNKKQMKLFKQF